jgi:hypothetical protein
MAAHINLQRPVSAARNHFHNARSQPRAAANAVINNNVDAAAPEPQRPPVLSSSAAAAPSLSVTAAALQRAAELSEQISAARRAPKTKLAYQGMLQVWQRFFDDHQFPFTIPDVHPDHVMKFFGWLCEHDVLSGARSEKKKAMVTMRSYKSAFLYRHEQLKVAVKQEVLIEMNNFLKGYQRSTTTWKAEGEMPINEGKHYFTMAGCSYVDHWQEIRWPEGER